MDRIVDLAAAWGLETEFRDAFGKMRTVEPAVLARVLEAFPSVEKTTRSLPRTIVFRNEGERAVRLDRPDGAPVGWTLSNGAGIVAQGQAQPPALVLPADLPNGIFDLELAASPEAASEHACVIVSPARAYQGAEHAPPRMWALAVQLYGVRSRRNWGHGDFGDLANLIALASERGAAGVGLNPLHALFDDHPENSSPYSPNSRLFLNPLYIDVEAVPEFPGLAKAGMRGVPERLRGPTMVDYRAVAEAKGRALRLAYRAFRRSGSAARRAAFERFRQERGITLARFAAFEALRRKCDGPWWRWPQEWQRPDPSALDRLRAAEPDQVGYVEYVQWLAHEQLDACRAQAKCGLPIGLYLDVAVGVRSDGFDAWSEQAAMLPRTTIGAPPDILNTSGQSWGLASFNPAVLEQRRFEPFRDVLEAAMRYAGAIRLDHVLGLKRLYLIPEGERAANGAYIRFPFEALLAVITLLSLEHRCIVIGEDLGTVPDNFRETLADWGLWSYHVLMFERAADGAFHAPESYRENALVTFATHDLPTFAGWKNRDDLATKAALGIDPGETHDERERAVQALCRALQERGLQCDFQGVCRYLADTPSRLLMIALEDVLGVTEQVNVPGTIDEHPNWRRRLPVALEDFATHDGLSDVTNSLRAAGRGGRERK